MNDPIDTLARRIVHAARHSGEDALAIEALAKQLWVERKVAAYEDVYEAGMKFVADLIREAIATAVAAEREACAQLAARECDIYNIGSCIAHDIRARGKESLPSPS